MILTSLVVLVLTSPTANLGLRDLSVLQISRVETSDRKARENRLTTIFRNFRLRVTIQRFRSVHLVVGLCVCVCVWVGGWRCAWKTPSVIERERDYAMNCSTSNFRLANLSSHPLISYIETRKSNRRIREIGVINTIGLFPSYARPIRPATVANNNRSPCVMR